jgi:hypothetical protein
VFARFLRHCESRPQVARRASNSVEEEKLQ